MKLNVNILIERLNEKVNLEYFGYYRETLNLSRPLFYDGEQKFKKDHLYIVLDKLLPESPIFENETVIVCVGNNPPKKYFMNKCALIVLNTTRSIQNVFNMVQMIFDEYDEWDLKLQKIVKEKQSFKHMLDICFPIFCNSILVLDDQLKCIAFSSLNNSIPDLDKQFLLDNFMILKENKKTNFHIEENEKQRIMCLNVFLNEEFSVGCYVFEDTKPFQAGHKALLRHLNPYINAIYIQHKKILSIETNWLKDLFIKIMRSEPIDNAQLRKKERILYNENDRYICVKCKMDNVSKIMPTEYACNQIEKLLPGSIAFVHQSILIFFINLRLYDSDNKNPMQIISDFLKLIECKAGVSKEFFEIEKAPFYFKQACAAIEIGYLYNPSDLFFYFENYINEYLVFQMTSELPADLLCADGLKKLQSYDAFHKTNYFEELRTYINCRLNAVYASKKLFIHRSTFAIHMERINELIGIDLENTENLLYIQLSYKMMESEGICNDKN